MNLKGSIANLQKRGAQLYAILAQRFSENPLIREIWVTMAQDEEQQIKGLKALPSTFWNQLTEEDGNLREAMRSCGFFKPFEKNEHISLQHSLARALDYEEPVILKIFVPLIRHLRKQSTDRTLEFYIMVKAHVARLVRTIESFAGDPILIQRSLILLQNFEKEIQVPEPALILHKVSGRKLTASLGTHASTTRKIRVKSHQAELVSRSNPLAKHSKALSKRIKPLVKKIKLPHRRVVR